MEGQEPVATCATSSAHVRRAVDAARRRVLAEVGGNRRQAAVKLGIGLRTLYDKLKRYELK